MLAVTDSHFVARRLHADEVDAALRLCRIEDISADVIAYELSTESDYCWMGLYSRDGLLAALHRGMRWDRYLLLKGLFVDHRFQRSGVGLRTALATRDWARREGFAGVLAWVETNRSESQLAFRLRIRPTGPLLHRYLVPVPVTPAGAGLAQRKPLRSSGFLAVSAAEDGLPAVGELLGIEQAAEGSVRIGWTLDRSRLVLSGNPCRSVADLASLVDAAEPVVSVTGATALEVPFEAADLHAALRLAGMGARRLSRSPVRLGMACFERKPSRTVVAQSPAAPGVPGVHG